MLKTALMLCFVIFLPAFGQDSDSSQFLLLRAESEFSNRHYEKALNLAQNAEAAEISAGRKTQRVKTQILIASAQISLKRFLDAENTLQGALRELSDNEENRFDKALLYIIYAWLYRTRYQFDKALEFSKKAFLLAPESNQIRGKHFLNVGRVLFASGYDISAIIWLEKAEKVFEQQAISADKLNTFRYLSLAWFSKLNYSVALRYAGKVVQASENTEFKQIYRQGLYDLAEIVSQSGQRTRALMLYRTGLAASKKQMDSVIGCNFLTTLLLNALNDQNLPAAADYLMQLRDMDQTNEFAFEKELGEAVLAAFKNDRHRSDNIFKHLEHIDTHSMYSVPSWKMIIAERNGDWNQFLKINNQLLQLTLKDNFSKYLPRIYLDFAKAYFHLHQEQNALEFLDKTIAYIEEIRRNDNVNLSINLFEVYHDAYRLLSQLKAGLPEQAFEYAERLKSRLLKDKINNDFSAAQTNISPEIKLKLEELSLKFVDGQSVAAEIAKQENLVTTTLPEFPVAKTNLKVLDEIPELDDTAIISYLFTLDKKLLAFVWEKNKPLQLIYLPLTEEAVDGYAKSTQQKIEETFFFKNDGYELYLKLLKPLNLTVKHLIIIPDKSLWKIPFQALSADGQKYLIEEKVISYAPSISVLINQLQRLKPNRRNLQAFANNLFNHKILLNVNSEAFQITEIYGTRPILNATVADFIKFAGKADVVHFSMHAEVDNEQPLNSFLAFKPVGINDGRWTVNELLKMKLKTGSLVFIASCDTNNVFSGEGLVSLAWGMMGAGATTVISANWEAEDKSTLIYTTSFYRHYKKGLSAAEALQQTSIEMIKSKSSGINEPYYWAGFTLNGDFR